MMLAHVVYCVDASFDRMAALYSLAFDEKHRSDRLSDGVGEYITTEYMKQREMLGDKCTASVYDQRESRVPVLAQTIISLSSDLPLASGLSSSIPAQIIDIQSFSDCFRYQHVVQCQ